VQTGLAAVVGVIIARKFERGAATDGFFAAYGVFIVVVLAANAIRVAVLPSLAQARGERRLGAEAAAYALTLGVLAVPLLALAVFAGHPVSWLLTGAGPRAARDTAADALPWMMLAAALQLFAGLAASALAALDDYVVSAVGYSVASVAGLVFILAPVDADGIQSIAWGMAVNGAIALLVPVAALAARARREAMPATAVVPGGRPFRSRVAEMGAGVALPLALQVIYVVCLPFAGREGVGSTTSFAYAYLIASAVVAVSASSVGLVTSVPLKRAGLDALRAAQHVVSSSWLALVLIGAVAGIFGLAGESIVHGLLGSAFKADVGSSLGRLVVVLSVWAAVSVGVSVAFPLMFVSGRIRRLPLLALAALVVHVPLALLGQMAGGLDGLALALAVTTALVLAVLLVELGAAAATVRGLAAAALTIAAVTVVAFLPWRFVLGPSVAAAVGVALYGILLLATRPPGLAAAWRYLRALA
jgi:hypothetical protein